MQGTIGEGFVDLVLVRVRDRRLLFAELKSERGKLTARQEEVLTVLRGIAGLGWTHGPEVSVAVWRPSDWSAIEAALR